MHVQLDFLKSMNFFLLCIINFCYPDHSWKVFVGAELSKQIVNSEKHMGYYECWWLYFQHWRITLNCLLCNSNWLKIFLTTLLESRAPLMVHVASAFSTSQQFLLKCMHQNSMCSLFEAFLHVLWAWTCRIVWSGSSSSWQFVPPIPSLFALFIQCGEPVSLSYLGVHSWVLGCQEFPAMGVVSIKELAPNSGSPWMSQSL